MYKSIVRPLFFKLSPEKAHKLVFAGLKLGQFLHLGPIVKSCLHNSSLHMETIVCGIRFPNKIGIAAGLDKNAEVYQMLGNFGFGHVEIGTVTPLPQLGNPKPRLFRLPADKALINRMGFNNNGLEHAINKLKKRNKQLIVGGNIGKNTATPNESALDDYIKCFTGLYDYVDYLVVNVSCPNISNLHKLQDQEELEKILGALNQLRSERTPYKPIFLKISPDLNPNQVDETLEVVLRNKIDGIIASNTTILRDGLTTPTQKINEIANGGLSGRPIRDRSTELIRYISKKTNGTLPIIGVGGVFEPKDAIEKLNAGASLVQVYTGFIYEGPGLAKRINKTICDSHM
jgi:dihydroorotate dehydrogenase